MNAAEQRALRDDGVIYSVLRDEVEAGAALTVNASLLGQGLRGRPEAPQGGPLRAEQPDKDGCRRHGTRSCRRS